MNGGVMMADKTQNIKTKLLFDGEQEYNRACKEINNSLKVLGSEMKVVSAQYDKNDKSADALRARQEVLSKTFAEQKKKVAEQEKALAELKAQETQNVDAITRFETALNKSKAAMIGTQKELEQIAEDLKNSGDGFDDLQEKAEKTSGGISTAVKGIGVAVAAIGTAVVAGIGYAVNFADEAKGAMNDFEAATGIANAGAKGFEDAMLNIYNGNYGENFEDIAASMATVAQSAKDLDPSNIEAMTTNAIVLRDTFGYDIQEQMRAVNMLMDQFGISGDEAFNLIAQGAQNGLDKNGDLLDSINEYSVHFKSLGLDAEDMFNSLANGAESGTFSVDKLGDAVKEFGIRVKDGTANDAFKQLGLDADATAAAFARGGDEASAAFAAVTDALFAMEDPLAQNALGVQMFGTMWEDLGAEGVKALTNLNGEISNTTDALGAINEVKYDDLGSALGGLGRVLQTSFVLPLGNEVLPLMNDFVNTLTQGAREANGDVGKLADTFGDALSEMVSGLTEMLPTVIEGAAQIIIGLANGLAAALPQLLPKTAEVITAIVQTLIDNIPMLIEAALQLIMGLANGLIEAIPVLIEAIPQIITSLVDALLGAIPQIIQTGIQLITSLVGALPEIITTIVAAIPQIIGGIVDALIGNIDQIIMAGVQLFVALIQNLPTIIVEIVKAVPQIITGIVNAFGSLAYKMVEIGGNLISGIWEGISGAASWLYEKVSGFFSGIVDSVKGFLGIHSPSTVFAEIGDNMAAGIGVGFGDEMGAVGGDMQAAVGGAGAVTAQEAIAAINNGIMSNIALLDQSVSAIVEQVLTALNAQNERFTTQGVEILKNIASGMITGIAQITAKVPQITQSTITAFIAQNPKFVNQGVEFDKNIASGMVSGVPQLTAKIPQIITPLIEALNGYYQRFVEAGENMVRGIWQGFQNMRGWLESNVRSMMREIVAAVEDEMDINSPSKVFAGIGEYMAAGIGVGFEKEMRTVEKNIKKAMPTDVFDDADPKPRQTPSGRIPRGEERGGGSTAGGVQVVQNFYTEGNDYAKQQREAAKQFKLIAREIG